MQSWGSRSRFQERDTEREPTKSGVVGLLCAALGRDRAESIDDLVTLRMGVRVDLEGRLEIDYHTALEVLKANRTGTDTQISHRAYLADAAFLVGLEGDGELLQRLHGALKNPLWPLFLGRKSFVPGCPLFLKDGLRLGEADTLETALAGPNAHPNIAPFNPHPRRQVHAVSAKVRLVMELPANEQGEIRMDSPLDFRHQARRFDQRILSITHVPAMPFPQEALCI